MGELPSIENVVLRLQKYRKGKDLWHAKHAYALVCKNGLDTQQAVGNHIVPMLVECGGMLEAEKAFSKLVYQNVHAWTSVISGCIERGQLDQAFQLYSKMLEVNVHPSSHTFVVLLKACIMLKDVKRGRVTHLESAEQGFKEDVFVNSSVMDMYIKCGVPSEARNVFNNLLVRDVVLWNTLIAGYVEHGYFKEALTCFKEMSLGDCSPNAITYACSLKACGCLGSIVKGQALHLEIVQRFLEMDLLVGNTLIDLYAKCNSLSEAQSVFDKMSVQDVVSWNALITGYARQGESDLVFRMFGRMEECGINPNEVTFLIILTVCSHEGLVQKGQAYFEAMSKEFGMIPAIKHQSCMLDLFGRTGQLNEAVGLVEDMQFQVDNVVWNSMLGACQKWGNLELGIGAFDHAATLEETHAGSFVLMSNIYADAYA
eukprot:c23424_g2_i3 orf=526-1809(+)